METETCRSISKLASFAVSIAFLVVFSSITSTEAYDSLDPNGNITIKWDIMQWTPDGYVAVVTMYNFQQYRHIQAPGWTLGWTWAKKEVIWSMVGAQTTEQGDCSKYKGNIPHCCKKDPTVVDLLPGTPYNMQIANCCKGGVINSWVQDPANAASSFQVSVGAAGTTNKTVRVPKNFTLKAPGPGYTCGIAKIVKPSKFVTQDGRRTTQALIKERGVFTIALTGGSLISLLRKLCEAPYNKTVDWTKWYVFWADERAVAKNHVDSNYKLTKDGFLSKVSVLNSHVHSINDNVTVDEAAREYEFVIRQLVKVRTVDVSESNDCPKFDLILLSMGSDGHVASLFPGHPALEQREDWVTYITNSPLSPPERITFTLPVINSASNVAIVAVGEDKAGAVGLAIDDENTEGLNGGSIPAKMIQPTEGKLVWFLDKPAASALCHQ